MFQSTRRIAAVTVGGTTLKFKGNSQKYVTSYTTQHVTAIVVQLLQLSVN